MPFGPNQRLQQGWYHTHGGGQEVLNEFYKKYICMTFLGGNTGCQMGGWFRKEIKTVADLKGLKFRIGGFAGRSSHKLGGVPQQIAGGDIYPALEKGTIDAAEWVGPYDDENSASTRWRQYYYYPGWWEGGSMLSLRQSRQVEFAAEGLPGDLGRPAVRQHWMMAKYDQVNPRALRRLFANGTKLHAFSPAIMEACYKAAKGLHDDIAKTNASFKKVYDLMEAFQGGPRIPGSASQNSTTTSL